MTAIAFNEMPEIDTHFAPNRRVVVFDGDVNDLLRELPDDQMKLIVTSPPYNVGKSYETRREISKYLEQQADVIKNLHRVLRPDGSICWQVGNYIENGEVFPLDVFFYPIFKSLGMILRNRIVWYTAHGLHSQKRFSGRYEVLLWFTKGEEYTFNLDNVRVPSKYPGKRNYKGPNKGLPSGNPKGKNPSNVWEIMSEEWEQGFWEIPNVKAAHPERTIHPAQFPIEVAERCVLALSDEDDWVFDPYAGVGTTIIAALKHNRRGMGSEKENTYTAIARERIAKLYSGQLPYRQLGKPIYRPSPNDKVAQVPHEWSQRSFGDKL